MGPAVVCRGAVGAPAPIVCFHQPDTKPSQVISLLHVHHRALFLISSPPSLATTALRPRHRRTCLFCFFQVISREEDGPSLVLHISLCTACLGDYTTSAIASHTPESHRARDLSTLNLRRHSRWHGRRTPHRVLWPVRITYQVDDVQK